MGRYDNGDMLPGTYIHAQPGVPFGAYGQCRAASKLGGNRDVEADNS